MADQETPIGTIPERLSALLTDWGTEFSMFLKELEEKRALLQELEAEAASESNKVEALNRRIEAQDTLIESLKIEAEEAVRLRKEIHAKDQELESVEDVSAGHADGTVAIDMRKALSEAQKVARSPEGLSSEPRSALNRARTR